MIHFIKIICYKHGLIPRNKAETRAHFGLWAALKSPLLIGTPLDEITEKDLKVLKNWEILAFNQDPLYGKPALPYKWGINPDWTWYVYVPTLPSLNLAHTPI